MGVISGKQLSFSSHENLGPEILLHIASNSV